jgi:hypothetical protein
MAPAVFLGKRCLGIVKSKTLDLYSTREKIKKIEIYHRCFAFDKADIVIKIAGYGHVEIRYLNFSAVINVYIITLDRFVEIILEKFGYHFPDLAFRISNGKKKSEC